MSIIYDYVIIFLLIGMEKNNNSKDSRKPWVKDIRNEGNKTLFGRSGIQIRGLRPSKSNITAESRPKRKKKYNRILDNSDDSEDNSPAHKNGHELSSSVHGNVKELNSSPHVTVKESTQDNATYNGKEWKNSSSTSTNCDDNSHFSVTTNKKHKRSKKKQSPPFKRISSSSGETDEYNWQVMKKHDGKKSGTSNKEASGIVIISSEAAETSSTDISVSSNNVGLGKRKRQLLGSDEASLRPSATKKLKSVLEESTEESSDSHWMSFRNAKKRGADQGFKKRKSAHLEDSSSSESEDKKKFPSLKKKGSLVLPNLSLKFISSDEESGDKLRSDFLRNVKPLKKEKTVEGDVSDLDSTENDLPMLVRPVKRHSSSKSESSNRSAFINASTVPCQLSEVGVKEDNNENSFPIEDPEYLSDVEVTPSEVDSDVPLEEIMRKWRESGTNEIEKIASIGDGISTEGEMAQDNDSDTNHSELLFTQNQKPIDGKVQNESGELSYTKEEECIFIADSDDDLYASMSEQNLTIDYDDNPAETDNDEDQLARFFLGDQEEDNIDTTIKAESPEHLLSFDWSKTPNKPEAVKENKYDTQINSVMKSERNDVYDADTQIIICDDFSDSDDERYCAETQIDGNCNADIDDEDADYYYCAPTQHDVFQQNLKNTGNNFDRETERSNAYYDAMTQPDSNVIQNKLPKRRIFDLDHSDDASDYDKETQVEKSHKTIEMKKCNRKESMDSLYYAPTQVDRTNKHSIVKRTSSNDGPCTVEHTNVETVKLTKQFSSPDEARKYLEKVKSTNNDLFADDETQEYDWAEEETITPKRKSIYSRNVKDVKKTVRTHEDVYDIMTQVKMDEKIKGWEYNKQHKIKTPIKMDEKKQDFEYEKTNDIKTPFKKDIKLEEQENEEKTDPVEIIEIDDEDDDELYNAATQVESNLKSSKNEKSNDGSILGKGMQQISNKFRLGVPQDIYDAMTQMEFMPKETNDVSKFYNAATQVVDKCQQQSDDECYIQETQNFSSDKQNGSDKEPKQVVSKTDNYIAQTQRVNEEEEISQDCYNTMTQVASNIENVTDNDSRNVFLALTQVENTVDSCENEELYTAETQVVNADDESGDKNSNANEANNESDASSEEYVCMLEEEESSEEKPESSYVPMLDDSPTEEESSLRSAEKITPKKDKTYERHTLLKKISSDDRKAKFTSPQKQKSLKEIRESFKIGKEQFYSKPPQPKLDAKHVSNCDNIIIVENDNWLSKQQKTRESHEKKSKKHSSKNVNVGNTLTMAEKIQEAKNRMAQREKQLAIQPRPVKRKRSVESK